MSTTQYKTVLDRRRTKIDDLTGLPGRDTLLGRLATLPDMPACAVLCIDIDQLASLNEAMGLSAGDLLIVEVARRIKSCGGPSDLLIRMDGDEFALLVEPLTNAETVEKTAAALVNALCAPYVIAGREVFVSATIGVASGGTSLLQHAEAALARAKESARGGWVMYTDDMARSLGEHFHLESELRHAIEANHFLVYYQPKASCRTGEVSGFEALLRWNHPDRGVVSPSEFIPTLERTGLIQRVGAWVLRTACSQLMDWIIAGYSNLHMAINLSVRQMADPEFVNQVQAILTELKVPVAQIELEITESMLVHDVSRSEKTLRQLKALGIQLSIDDFGTGYSSLSYLKHLPINTIKVDRSFVQDINIDPNDASITRAIISMAHSLKLKVVAEGIETEAQLAMLVAEQCETVQGYYVSKPLAAEAATQFLASRWTIATHLLTRPRGDRTLLLIDDEESILQALNRQLRREGYRILSGRSGAEGLEILAKNDVDVVLSDQRMPGMTGEDFLRRVKELYPDTVRMVLSGYADMDSITNSINQGAIFKFICKPWDDKTLKDVILEAFQRKELNDARLRRATEIAAANVRLQESNQSLSLMLAEQSQSALKSQTALLLAQENLDKLPVPVMGLDTSGRIVLRNEAIGAVPLTAQAVSSLIDQFPANQDRGPFQLFYREPEGTCWRIVARHLTLEEQHRGTVLAFIEVEP